jgi:hypothetical protein
LSDVHLNSLQRRNVLGHLLLLGSDSFYAAPHDIETGRQWLKLLLRARGSRNHGNWLRGRNG